MHSPHQGVEKSSSIYVADRSVATDAKFARPAVVGPVSASSGKRVPHRLNPGGNRRLNWALHRIARRVWRLLVDSERRDP
jgi:hypothetical protein